MSRVGNAWLALRGQPLADPIPGSGVSILERLTGAWRTVRRSNRGEQAQSMSGWIAAAVQTIATDVRSAGWEYGTIDSEGEFTQAEPPPLLVQPHSRYTFEDVLEITSQQLDLIGEAFWYVLSETEGGTAFGWEPLPSHLIEGPGYNSETMTWDGWRYNAPQQGVVRLADVDTIFTRIPHPREPMRGMSAVEAAGLSHDMDLYAKAYGTSILEGGGLPVGILSIDGPVTPAQATDIQEAWRQRRAEGRDAISVVGEGATYQSLGVSIRDVEFVNLSRMNRDQILAIFGVPAGKLGLIEDVNRANDKGIDLTYTRDTLSPRLARIADAVNRNLLPRLGIPGVIRFENVVPADRDFELRQANDAFDRGAITIDEYREANGMEPLESGEGDLYKLASGVRYAETHESLEPVAPPPGEGNEDDPEPPPPERGSPLVVVSNWPAAPAGAPAEDLPEPRAVLEDIDWDQLDEVSLRQILQLEGVVPKDLPLSKLDREAAWLRYENRALKREAQAKAIVRQILANQQKALVKAIKRLENPPKLDRSMRHWATGDIWERWVGDVAEIEQTIRVWDVDDEEGMVLRRDLLDRVFAQQRRAKERALAKVYLESYEDGWDMATSDFGRELVSLETVEAQVLKEARSEAEETVAQIEETTRREVTRVVAEGVAAGLTVAAIAQEVSRLYDQWKGARAETIARTETGKAIQAGHQGQGIAAERRLKVKVRNTWVTTLDGKERQAHHDANGQRRPLGRKFDVGGEELRRPLDPDGSAANVINCRCILVSEATPR